MRNIILFLTLVFFAQLAPVYAGQTPVVVELFTSQGCSSCPPADRFLGKLSKRSDVIALALHVDYWDYLGWKDSFGSAKFSERQRAYAESIHNSTIYTPQMIVQGASPAVGNRVDEVQRLIARHASQTAKAEVALRREGDMLVVVVKNTGRPAGRSIVQLVRYAPKTTVTIRAGENAGKRIEYNNTVTKWVTLAKWNGRAPLTLRRAVSGRDPIVVLVQSVGYGPIIAAHALK